VADPAQIYEHGSVDRRDIILGLLHALCWLHAERSVRKLVPLSAREREAIEGVRDDIWTYYQRLKAYRESPTPRRKAGLERDFDRLFTRRSELGRRCRDTLISLKKTCRKLGVSFWRYLQDRIRGLHEILPLPDLMRQAAQETT
jgi:hypothetical protein